ncbi:hypothetical protein DMC61_14520 [Amycolatopsis sp. WAC 04169]|uniref:hypothetical protein n=1 Tax=Amycolatopsis sp. WAC 04169 TaxID=2203197 RepID=UPI000F7B3445|nr:hypothetical protein [Amycolatopsis sp. WAC 04169]RSN31360.1 hypothetical protein DMC61_14520 [Amycolatopsis sp. WAC 04169]
MSADRTVLLKWDHRTAILVDADTEQAEVLAYPGLALVYRGAELAYEIWVPVGDRDVTFAEDEVLIAALRTAWRWSQAEI